MQNPINEIANRVQEQEQPQEQAQGPHQMQPQLPESQLPESSPSDVNEFGYIPGSGSFTEATCKRVASLVAYGCSDEAIMESQLISAEDLAEIQRTETFMFEKSMQLEKGLSLRKGISEGWDGIEHAAQGLVLRALNTPGLCDPKFALAAAATANKAVRPAATGQKLEVNTAQPVVLVLPVALQERIAAGSLQVIEQAQGINGTKLKDSHTMPVNEVEKLLDPTKEEREQSVSHNGFMQLLATAFGKSK